METHQEWDWIKIESDLHLIYSFLIVVFIQILLSYLMSVLQINSIKFIYYLLTLLRNQ